jgi:hypothetical protein
MATEGGGKTISFPATGAGQRCVARTKEADAPLLVLGYSTMCARNKNLFGSTTPITSWPKWRLSSSDGWSFSREEIDLNCWPQAGPGRFYRDFAMPFLLPAGSSLGASFSTFAAIPDAEEQLDNYVFFRCVTV